MALDLLQDGETFEVCDKDLKDVADGDKDVMYTLRKLEPKRHREMLRKHTKSEFVRGQGRVERVDTEAASDDILDYVLVEWTGVTLKGQPAPCTREYKLFGLDFSRRAALIDRATTNEARAAERRAESFRETAGRV